MCPQRSDLADDEVQVKLNTTVPVDTYLNLAGEH
jgi:hypothetical protein